MSNARPESPSHLSKRKRSIDDHEGPTSPPHKVQAATASRVVGPSLPPNKNPDEVDLDVDESENDGYGPTAPPSTTSAAPSSRTIGPSLPPARNPDEVDLSASDSDDAYGPSIPSTTNTVPLTQAKRILGPALPPAPLSEKPSQSASAHDSSDSEDDYGPSLPPAPGTAAHSALLAGEPADSAARSPTASAAAKPKRADWMLAPPSADDWSSRVDPTKLKNRKFASGKGARGPAQKGGISAIWTETPEEKRQRLEDEVLGRKDAATTSDSSSAVRQANGASRDDEATARRIEDYNARNRNRSLYAEREALQERGEKKKEQEDDPSKRGFDREKDMALGGRLGNKDKKEMLAKAADFGSRFQKGRYL